MPTTHAIHTAHSLGQLLEKKKLFLATAESCTGGLIAATLTDVPGASQWFLGAVVAYANEVKEQVLHVPHKTLLTHGAVSGETVEAMALGACRTLKADLAVAVSGIAGPTGGTPDKPVGLVCFGIAFQGKARSFDAHFKGTREEVRVQTVEHALEQLVKTIS